MMARGLCALLGLAFVGCEAFGVYDFLSHQQGPEYLVLGGVLVAIATPFTPTLAAFFWQAGKVGASLTTWAAFVAAVCVVMLSAVYRTGAATDDAEAIRQRDNRSLELAQERKRIAESDLEAARRSRDDECNGRGQKGVKCAGERVRVEQVQERYDSAVAALSSSPTQQRDPLASRIVSFGAAAGVRLTETEVRIFQPMMLPAVLFAFGTLFLTAGLHTPKTVEPLSGREKHRSMQLDATQPKPREPPTPQPIMTARETRPAEVLQMRPRVGQVSKFLIASIAPAPGGRIEAGEALVAYRAWCASMGLQPAPVDEFARELRKLCRNVGIKTEAQGQHVYCLDIKLAS